MFLPLLQKIFSIIHVQELYGKYEMADKPKFSTELWFNGDYQKQCDKYINNKVGFRPLFIRTHSQIYYSIFHTSASESITLGKEGYIYETSYINSYIGLDYIGDKEHKIKFHKLKKLQDTLQSLNKKLIIILAPSKASFYPEYIPDRFFIKPRKKTNYEEVTKQLSKTNVPYIDFSKWFRTMKKTSKYTLMNKNGIHWTRYGEILAMDSLIKFVSKSTQVNLPKIKYDSLTYSQTPQFTDNDISQTMNLFYVKKDLKLTYPRVSIDSSKADKKKLRSLVVGDSFYWGMYYLGLSDKVFDRGEFWYYFQDMYPEENRNGKLIPRYVSLANMKDEIKKFDVIIFLQTESNLNNLGFGFIEKLYDFYFLSDKESEIDSERLKSYEKQIRSDKKWFELVKQKAKKNNIPIEVAVRNDAIYMVEQEKKNRE
jgi:hypothetical protein